MGKDEVVELARRSLKDELEAVLIYGKLAKLYHGKGISRKLVEIARMEGRHVAYWREFLRRRGVNPDKVRPNRLKITLYTLLFRIIGLGLTIKLLEAGELEAIETYARLLESSELTEDEKEELKRILEDELVHEDEFIEEESRLKDFLNHVRDAVLGMSDGVVEVLSVSAGLAGAYGEPVNVALGGLIVGIAGALSMGIGSFTSVRAQKQVRLGVLSKLMMAVKYIPNLFYKRIASYMVRKGFSKEVAEAVAADTLKNKELLRKIIAEEEYGIREKELENPGKAGLYTGLFYIIGAIVPLIPYFLGLSIGLAVPLSFIMAAVVMALTGFLIAVSANLSIKAKMAELVLAGLGSALLTFAIGRLASAVLGIEVE